MQRCLAVVLLVLVWLGTAWSTTYTVSPSGNDSSCGNIGTIKYGINNCARNPGDILDIRAGTYPEQLHRYEGTNWPNGTGWNANQAITIQGHVGETVIIKPNINAGNANVDGLYIDPGVSGVYLSFDNLIFDGSDIRSGPGGTLVHLANYNRMQYSVVRNYMPGDAYRPGVPFPPHTNGILCGSHNILSHLEISNVLYGIYLSKGDNLVEYSSIHDTGGYGIHHHDGGSIATCSNGPVTIRYNVIARAGRNGATPQTGGAMTTGMSTGSEIYGNTFVDSACAPCGGIQVYRRTCDTKVYYNTIVGNPGGCIDIGDTTTGTVVRNNICYDNGSGGILDNNGRSTVDHNWLTPNGDPQFANRRGGDYHLTAGSPLTVKDGGAPIPGMTTDASQPPITRDATPSMGAYEFGGTAAPAPIASTFYLSPTGTDAVDCVAAQSLNTPRAKLANVLPCAAGGSSIWYRSGTYTDTQALDTAALALAGGTDAAHPTIIGTLPSDRPGGQAILRSTTGGVLWFFRAPATDKFIQIQSLTFDSTLVPGSNGVVFYPGVHDISLIGSTLKNAHFEPLFVREASNITVLDSLIDTSTVTCAIGVDRATNLVIAGSTVQKGKAGGYCTYGSGATNTHIERTIVQSNEGPGLALAAESTPFLANNLIQGNASGVGLGSGTTGAEVYNSTMHGNAGVGLAIAAGVTSTVRNNIIFGNGAGMTGTPTTASANVLTDPGFVPPGPPTTFHVQGESVVGKGDTIATVTTDLAGKSRTAPYTIGAYEDEAVVVIPPPQPSGATVRIPPYGSVGSPLFPR